MIETRSLCIHSLYERKKERKKEDCRFLMVRMNECVCGLKEAMGRLCR